LELVVDGPPPRLDDTKLSDECKLFAHLWSVIYICIQQISPCALNDTYSVNKCYYEKYFFSLEKDVSKRPTYDDLLKQPFILTSEAEDTEIGVWYRLVMEEAKSLGLHQQ